MVFSCQDVCVCAVFHCKLSEQVVYTVAYWEKCIILLTCESVAEEIITLHVSVILRTQGGVESHCGILTLDCPLLGLDE